MNKKTFFFGGLALCVTTVSLAMEREKKQRLKLLNYKNILYYSAREILDMCTLGNKANPLGKENQNLSSLKNRTRRRKRALKKMITTTHGNANRLHQV